VRSNLTQLEQLYRQHRRELIRLVDRELHDVHESEDVVQVTFLKARQAIERGAVPRNPRAWLATIAINTARRALRHRILIRDAEECAIDVQAPLTAELHDAMGILPENQRAAVVYRDLLGLSYDETAAAMGTTVGSVQMLLHRGRKRLRSLLEGSFSVAGLARWLRGAATLAHAPAAQVVAGATAGLGLALAGGAVALHVTHAGQQPKPTISAVSASAHRVPRRAADSATRPPRPAASASTRHPTPFDAVPPATPRDTEPSPAAAQSEQPHVPHTSTAPTVQLTVAALPVAAPPVPALPAPTITAPAFTASIPTITVPGIATLTVPTSTTPTVTIP
jgi:RNA polymerase sigma-70 factor (ECF subfamily)